jgi:hypothetical protein
MLEKLFKLYDIEEARRCREYAEYEERERGFSFDVKPSPNKYLEYYDRFKQKLKNHKFGSTTKTGENLDYMIQYGLSIEEASIVYMYTIDTCFGVNHQLRNCTKAGMDLDVREYSHLLSHVLGKLPSYSCSVVHRDISNPDNPTENIMEEFKSKLGQVHFENAFMSSHIDPTIWSNPELGGIHMIIITKENSKGKDLSGLSFNATEKEVLFDKGASFLVKCIREKNVIILKEV